MIIKKIEIENYRNYEKQEIIFDDKTNIIYGDNAQGKTNILEAVFISGTTKSHKGSKDGEIVKLGKEDAYIRAVYEKNGVEKKVNMQLRSKRKKSISVNGQPLKRAAELMGLVNIVFFSPEDLGIIKSGPALRRRFIDMQLCQLDNSYLYDLTNYNRIVNQRNKLLKSMERFKDISDTIDVWDEQLVFYGTKVIKRRNSFIDELSPVMERINKSISGRDDSFKVIYDKDCSDEEYEKKLKSNKEKDIRYKTTSVGPHRDDLVFLINDMDIRKFGSQGQQRTAALSLKLSEVEFVKMSIGDTPILLLDDVLSELDSSRQNFLLSSIRDIQTIITCTGLDDFIKNRFTIDKCFNVKNGMIEVKDQKGAV